MYRLYGDLSSVTTLQSWVAESIGIGWRLPSEWGGGINRNQVADCVGIRISSCIPGVQSNISASFRLDTFPRAHHNFGKWPFEPPFLKNYSKLNRPAFFISFFDAAWKGIQPEHALR